MLFRSRAGRLRALAVSSSGPSALAPGLPPMADAVPGYEAVSMFGMWLPAQAPAALIRRLNADIVRVIRSAEVREKFLSVGVEAAGTTPEQFSATMEAEMARLGRVIREAHIRAE